MRWALSAALLVAVAATSGGTATAGALAPAKRPVPAALTAVESSAEDIVDYALSRDRANVIAGAGELRAAARGPAVTALATQVPAAMLARLRQRADGVARLARGGSFIGIALAANNVSQLMPDLYGRFQDPVPAAILTLDYLDREAQLRSLAGQTPKVGAAVKRLRPVWAAVRPRVVAAGGVKEAAAYQRHVTAMSRLAARAGKPLQAEAEHGLALVDELEQVFAR